MDNDEYTRVVQREGARFLEVAATDLAAAVGACPGWDMTRLVGHVGQVHGWIARTVSAATTDPPTHSLPELPDPEEILEWGQRQLDEILSALRGVVPGTPCWNWGRGDTIDFFPRRMAHETVVHRYDAEAAVGALTPIDSDLATDGVDEVIEVALQFSNNPKKKFDYPDGSLHLHRTDGPGEWLLSADGSTLNVRREHAKGDVAVRGSGPDLLLYMWGRGDQDLEIFGDADLADAWGKAVG